MEKTIIYVNEMESFESTLEVVGETFEEGVADYQKVTGYVRVSKEEFEKELKEIFDIMLENNETGFNVTFNCPIEVESEFIGVTWYFNVADVYRFEDNYVYFEVVQATSQEDKMSLEKIYDKLQEIEYLESEGSVPMEVLEKEKNRLNEMLKGMVC